MKFNAYYISVELIFVGHNLHKYVMFMYIMYIIKIFAIITKVEYIIIEY
jgi:hypothetical protein